MTLRSPPTCPLAICSGHLPRPWAPTHRSAGWTTPCVGWRVLAGRSRSRRWVACRCLPTARSAAAGSATAPCSCCSARDPEPRRTARRTARRTPVRPRGGCRRATPGPPADATRRALDLTPARVGRPDAVMGPEERCAGGGQCAKPAGQPSNRLAAPGSLVLSCNVLTFGTPATGDVESRSGRWPTSALSGGSLHVGMTERCRYREGDQQRRHVREVINHDDAAFACPGTG